MDRARAVLRRPGRIEAVGREGGPPRSLLAGAHALLRGAEAWVAPERGGGDRGRGAAQRSLRADLDLGRAALPRAPPETSARVTTDRGRVLGAGKPRRRALRQAYPDRRRAPPLRLVGQRDGGGGPRRR